jgi:hypothetical protein
VRSAASFCVVTGEFGAPGVMQALQQANRVTADDILTFRLYRAGDVDPPNGELSLAQMNVSVAIADSSPHTHTHTHPSLAVLRPCLSLSRNVCMVTLLPVDAMCVAALLVCVFSLCMLRVCACVHPAGQEHGRAVPAS